MGLRAAWVGVRRGRPRPGPWCKGDERGGDARCLSLGVTGRTVSWKDCAFEPAASSTSAPGSPPSRWRVSHHFKGKDLRGLGLGSPDTEMRREEGERRPCLGGSGTYAAQRGDRRGSA